MEWNRVAFGEGYNGTDLMPTGGDELEQSSFSCCQADKNGLLVGAAGCWWCQLLLAQTMKYVPIGFL